MSCTATDSHKMGTPFYIAPEIDKPERKPNNKKIKYTNKVDIYALGIILLEILVKFPTQHQRINVL